jgi:hypothetical protein
MRGLLTIALGASTIVTAPATNQTPLETGKRAPFSHTKHESRQGLLTVAPGASAVVTAPATSPYTQHRHAHRAPNAVSPPTVVSIVAAAVAAAAIVVVIVVVVIYDVGCHDVVGDRRLHRQLCMDTYMCVRSASSFAPY